MTYSTQGIIDLTVALIKNMGVENAISAVNMHLRDASLAKEEEITLKWKNVKGWLMIAREGQSIGHSVERIRRGMKGSRMTLGVDTASGSDYSALTTIDADKRIVSICQLPGASL